MSPSSPPPGDGGWSPWVDRAVLLFALMMLVICGLAAANGQLNL